MNFLTIGATIIQNRHQRETAKAKRERDKESSSYHPRRLRLSPLIHFNPLSFSHLVKGCVVQRPRGETRLFRRTTFRSCGLIDAPEPVQKNFPLTHLACSHPKHVMDHTSRCRNLDRAPSSSAIRDTKFISASVFLGYLPSYCSAIHTSRSPHRSRSRRQPSILSFMICRLDRLAIDNPPSENL